MEILTQAAQFILSLSLIVTLHELGHFLPARWFKVRVEKFYLFFDPWFSLWKKKKGDTEYGVGWLPLGGYVKLAGMVDESMDKEQLAKPPQPWEFRSKPAWQRLIIMVGGVTVNLLLGLLIYIGVLYVWGKEYLPLSEVRYGVHVSEVMQKAGFQEGDIILGVEGVEVHSLEDVGQAILIGGARRVEVERDGARTTVVLDADVHDRILASGEKLLFAPRVPLAIDSVIQDGPAARAGLLKTDKVLAVGGVVTPYFGDLRKALAEHKGSTVEIKVERGRARMALQVPVSEEGTIGVANKAASEFFTPARETYGFLASIPAGIHHGLEKLSNYVSSMKLLFTKAGASQIGGFGTIGSLFSPTWDWQQFWNLTAFLSIILAFMNILPIPALDGGHVVFLIYEMIMRRPAPQRVLEVAQLVGMVLLFALMLFANGNDLFKGITGRF